jgi:RNA polymerase subunit RPABC4/transcription elongation factor Spt4
VTTTACFNCGDPTHWRRDCPVCGNDRRRHTSQQSQVVVISNLEQTAEIFVRTEIFELKITSPKCTLKQESTLSEALETGRWVVVGMLCWGPKYILAMKTA